MDGRDADAAKDCPSLIDPAPATWVTGQQGSDLSCRLIRLTVAPRIVFALRVTTRQRGIKLPSTPRITLAGKACAEGTYM